MSSIGHFGVNDDQTIRIRMFFEEIEAFETSEVAEAAEINETAEVSKTWKITKY